MAEQYPIVHGAELEDGEIDAHFIYVLFEVEELKKLGMYPITVGGPLKKIDRE